jgi:hypothetical protein
MPTMESFNVMTLQSVFEPEAYVADALAVRRPDATHLVYDHPVRTVAILGRDRDGSGTALDSY